MNQSFLVGVLNFRTPEELPELAAQCAARGAKLALCGGGWDESSAIAGVMKQTAAACGLWLCCCVRGARGDSRGLLISPAGEQTVAKKIHYGGTGAGMTCVDTPLGKLGLSVGGDVRFPELYRGMALAGVQTFLLLDDGDGTVDSRQWELLTRARAIENGCCLVAAGQDGGRVVDANGMVVARASAGQPVLLGEIDYGYLEKVRRDIPTLKHLRHEVYQLKIQ